MNSLAHENPAGRPLPDPASPRWLAMCRQGRDWPCACVRTACGPGSGRAPERGGLSGVYEKPGPGWYRAPSSPEGNHILQRTCIKSFPVLVHHVQSQGSSPRLGAFTGWQFTQPVGDEIVDAPPRGLHRLAIHTAGGMRVVMMARRTATSDEAKTEKHRTAKRSDAAGAERSLDVASRHGL